LRTAGVLAFAVALIAGCSSSASKAASSSTPSTSTAKAKAAAAANAQATFYGRKVLTQTATGKSPCEKASPTPASPGEVGNGSGGSSSNDDPDSHGPRGELQQLPVSSADQKVLTQQMAEAKAVAAKYPTVATAKAAGYVQSTVYVPCIGAHFTNLALVDQFNAAKPSELLYDGTTPNSKIVGLSYLVWHPGGPPPGFAGPNDVWHQHNANGGLCLRGNAVVGGEAMSPKTCALIGGQKSAKLMANAWMVHAWVAPGWKCGWGVFAGECPALGGVTGGTAYSTGTGYNTGK
jgi:hypothetical protein